MYPFDVVRFNTRAMTLDFSRSIVRGTIGLGYEVQVIAKGSSDSFFSRFAIEDEFESESRASNELAPSNLGFAAANNLLVGITER
jgi:hypothetical protein